MQHRYRSEVGEEVLRQNGSNADIQRRVMQEFPDSRSNPTRAQWDRRSWETYHHGRGNQQARLLRTNST